MSGTRVATSLAIAAALLLQLSTFRGSGFYPFVEYDMYRKARAPGPIARTRVRLWGTTRDGSRISFKSPQKVGVARAGFRARYLEPMLRGEVDAARGLAEVLGGKLDSPVVRFDLTQERFELRAGGIEAAPPLVVTFDLGAS